MNVTAIATRSQRLSCDSDRAWHDPLRPVPGWTYRGDDRTEGSSVLHRNPGSSGAEIQTEPPTSAVQRICGSCCESERIDHNCKKAVVCRLSRLTTAFLIHLCEQFLNVTSGTFQGSLYHLRLSTAFSAECLVEFFANSLTSVELLPMIYR